METMSVQQLPAGVIKLISSTQVISSISSVVKELIENSIDAGANVIDIKLEKNGLDKIEVRDNGSGINSTDIYNVCLPSYTSKIHNLDDLEYLESYGFRGEALHSLCAISQVLITTKTNFDEIASTYTYDHNGTVRDVKPSHQMTGTVVTVTNLFRNVPVRKQVYENSRKGAEELKKIEKVIKLLSIIHPKLRVTVAHNKCLIWHKTSVYSLRQSLMQVYPQAILKNLQDVSCELENMSLEMLIAKRECNLPVLCQPISEAILLYINQRPVKDKKIEKVVLEEMNHLYASTLPANKCPLTLISIKLPPQSLDVNLEPNKTKVFIKDHEVVLKQLRERIMLHFYEKETNPNDPKALLLDPEQLQNPPKKRKLDDVDEDSIENDANPNDVDIDMDVSKMRTLVIEKTNNTNSEMALKELADIDFDDFKENISIGSTNRQKVVPENVDSTLADRVSLQSLNNSITENTNDLNSISYGDLFDEDLSVGDKPRLCENINSNCIANDEIVEKTPNDESTREENLKNEKTLSNNLVDDQLTCPDLSVVELTDTVTLSQWSRGRVIVDNEPIQGGAVIINESKQEHIVKEVPKLNKPKLKKDIDDSQTEIDRSVSSQMGCKDMAGFTHFARQIRSDIIKETPGISFTKVAGELANRWRNLQDEQKNKFKEEAKTKKFVPVEDKTKALFKKKTLALTVSMNQILEDLKIPGSLGFSRLNENKISLIGPLETNKDWLCKIEDHIKLVSVGHLQENVLFHRYMCNSSLPLRQLDHPTEITLEMLGSDLWSFLSSAERICDDHMTYISDQKIYKNGFKVIVNENTNAQQFLITEVAKELDEHCIVDVFKETLVLAKQYEDLEDCRAVAVKKLLLKKVVEVCEEKSVPCEVSEVSMLLRYWVQCMSQKKICTHEQPIAVNLHRFEK